MIQQTKNGYIRRTSSGVMKCGSSLSFGSKCRNDWWEQQYKELDSKMKTNRERHGVWCNRPIYEGQYIRRKSGNRKSIIFSTNV